MDILLKTILPAEFLNIIPAFALIIIGAVVEKHYVGRIAIFANAIALSTYYYEFTNLPFWLVAYVNILTIAGILCFVSYVSEISLPSEFYTVSGIFSSFISGIVLLYGLQL